jgi:protein-S-isoprenylcysteine O-methyltransferase Ste14
METAWYFKLLVSNIGLIIVSFLLFLIIKAKRMTGPCPGKRMQLFSTGYTLIGLVLTWFISYSINAAFWIGLVIIIFGEIIFSSGFMAMREHPEKKQAVVDWDIYKVSRHSHVLAGKVCLLGVVIMGWSPGSVLYILLWVYYILSIALMHSGVLSEEKSNIERFGQEYIDYMKRVPRYFGKL